jgi:hypothetical protein
LLFALWLTLAVVGFGCAAVTYFVSRQETNSQLDYQMEQIATFVGAQSISAASSTAIIPQPSLDHDIEGAYVVGVRDAAGHVLYASRPEIRALALDWLGFRTVTLGVDEYRDFSALSGSHRIAVAQQIELLGSELDARSRRPGETLRVTLYWRALSQMPVSYRVFVHLVGQNNASAGGVDVIPARGAFPTVYWKPGDTLRDATRLLLADPLPLTRADSAATSRCLCR